MDFLRLSAEQRSSLESATAKYQAAMAGGPVISYLESRGIPESVAATARLGWVDEPEPGHEFAQGRLALPHITPTGVVYMGFRRVDDGTDFKYLYPPGEPTRLFNVMDLHVNSEHIAICEGQIDAITMSGIVGIPAVGILGVNGWKSHHRHCFADFARVFIVMDSDDAGRKAADKLRRDLPNGVVITPPKGMDVNAWYASAGPDSIREALGVTA